MVGKKFSLDEMKKVCDKILFLKSHPRCQNYQKGAIFGNFSSVYTKNRPAEKICNGFACYPSKSLRGQPRNHFKQNLRSLSPFVRFLQDFETSATLRNPLFGHFSKLKSPLKWVCMLPYLIA